MNRKCKLLLTILSLVTLFTSCQKEEFELSSNANDLFHLKNGDFLIPVLVSGNTSSKKIILYIQGGPGSNTLDFAEIDYPGWNNTLEKEYAVAYYDQRGTGNRQGNFSLDQISIDSYLDDLHKVATFLKIAYNAEVIMMGHSFGGQLMYRYMLKYNAEGIPNKYISVDGTVTNDKDPLRWEFRRKFLYNTANLEIANGRNVEEWKAVLIWLSTRPTIETNEDKDQWNDFVEQLVYVYYPEKSLNARNYLNVLFSSPYNPIPAYLNGKVVDDITSKLFEDLNSFNLTSKLSGINQNILLITGRYDDVCPPEEMNHVFGQISSSVKQFEIIENAGHESFNHQPDVFANLIIEYIQ
jgi:pimeloyl-ACP methyl ester carboxylesterase